MFLANGEFNSEIGKKNTNPEINGETIEGFGNEDCGCGSAKQSNDLVGVGDSPTISDDEILNAQKLIEENKEGGKKLDKIKSLEIGSLFHKKIRSVIRPFLKPGLKLSELANIIENTCTSLTKENGVYRGIGFPVGLSVNECAAHFTPSKSVDLTLDEDSVTKIDIGVEVNGWITDCAFTFAFNDKYKNLLDGVKEATNHGIKTIGIDQHIGEWGGGIKEIMDSYEVNIDGKDYPILNIKNLGGHNILKNRIHGGFFLPSHNNWDNRRFVENVYAIETFASTKSHKVIPKNEENTIYMRRNFMETTDSLKSKMDNKYVKIFDILHKNFNTLPFCDRFLESDKVFQKIGFDKSYILDNFKRTTMNYFNTNNIISIFPPLYCENNGMTAQYEHTVYVSENKPTIIFSNSTDY